MMTTNKNVLINLRVKKNLRFISISVLQILMYTSCEKFTEVPPPPGQITENTVFKRDATAIAVLTDLFGSLNSQTIQGPSSIGLKAGLSADEYQLNEGVTDAEFVKYYHNDLSETQTMRFGSEHWSALYNYIFRCNAAIEGLNASNSLSPAVKQQLIGEAKFMRAFFYFYLVNLFGDVPLALTTDPVVNTNLSRSLKSDVYQFIKSDLIEAKDLLSDNFLSPTLLTISAERVRPTKWSASALLARVYLFTGDWANAITQSSNIIDKTDLFSLPTNLNEVFLKNSNESIWQIQPVDLNFNTSEARALVIPPGGPTPGAVFNPIKISAFLISSVEPNDQRWIYGNWIDTTVYYVDEVTTDTAVFAFKYKVFEPSTDIDNSTGSVYMTEYFMIFRLAEQYLIRAEARAQLGNIAGSQDDLNAVRNRAGLGNTLAADQLSLLTAILHERRLELFGEWGHRWFDLKRTNTIDAVMTSVTPIKSNGVTSWQSYQQLYPLPYTEMQRAPNMSQNVGY